ncbi:hypothetical protein PCL_10519 [Purpureocillium lilacinum]|uniref:Uncharacterized protein n=1 Tax=Purpureocillium lilacinum TaxID=33203 RepID=A0A2U3DQ51_PURLI|nr:hypothetical protein PCL_10519 [Purpureocillium lilacinum]
MSTEPCGQQRWKDAVLQAIEDAKRSIGAAIAGQRSNNSVLVDQLKTLIDDGLNPRFVQPIERSSWDGDLEDINTSMVDYGEAKFDEFAGRIGALKNQPPADGDWKKIIRDAADNAKTDIVSRIDQAADQAINYIENQVPEEERPRAANKFQEGCQHVLSFAEKLVGTIGKVLLELTGLAEAWKAVSEAAEGVKHAANEVKKLIKKTGLFSLHATWTSNAQPRTVGTEVGCLMDAATKKGVRYLGLYLSHGPQGWMVQSNLDPKEEWEFPRMKGLWNELISSATSATAGV